MSDAPHPLRTGMCSVTLRDLPALDVLDVAHSAGLGGVEWGGDKHVPPGDPDGAARVADACRTRGVRVTSYGSYFRAGPHGAEQFAPVLAAAVALGAPRVRIWAGDTGSAQATPAQRRAVVAAARGAAERAAAAGVELAFEYHGNTLTDTAESTVRLLEDVDHPAVRTYWQPPVGFADAEALDGLERVLPWVSAVHVFSWWPLKERLPLADRRSLWLAVCARLRLAGRPFDLLLEFVPGNDPAQVAVDAATLTRFRDLS
jgi:sugar phosphate isomerase/epimerase